MSYKLIKEDKFSYIEIGEGQPIVVLHGLMGTLSNFDGVLDYFPKKGYKLLVPELPIYSLSLIKTNVKNLAKFVKEFIDHKELENVILLGNSLGGHIALYFTKLYQDRVKALILTGSSGLYENSMGDTYPKRGDYDFIKKKAQDVFYDPEVATKEIVDDVFETVNNRNKVIKTLAIAKSAIRHNMAKDLPNITIPVCLIWGKNDTVTPPEVADEFHELLPNSDLYWIDKCGHAAMMELPDTFNEILDSWFTKRNI
ncbi:alpha/beta fold hydrolase [Aureivirga marina]|uniref:alpha/beta fold hydrolase n=1 Tax=Aureivirga marina TaxID=1182451 RepID=UPI0018C98CD9|nr:alpha/beta hydrolase [Aureivirga marina]